MEEKEKDQSTYGQQEMGDTMEIAVPLMGTLEVPMSMQLVRRITMGGNRGIRKVAPTCSL